MGLFDNIIKNVAQTTTEGAKKAAESSFNAVQQQQRQPVPARSIWSAIAQQAARQQAAQPQQQEAPVQPTPVQAAAPQPEQPSGKKASKKDELKQERTKGEEAYGRFMNAFRNNAQRTVNDMVNGNLVGTQQANAAEAEKNEEAEEAKPEVTTEGSSKAEAKGIGERLRDAKENPEAARARTKEENKLPSSIEAALKDSFGTGNMTDEQRDEFYANILNDPYAQMSIDNGDRISQTPLISDEMTDEQKKEFSQYMFDDPYAQMMLGKGNKGVPVSPIGRSAEDVQRARNIVYPYRPDTKLAAAPEPEDNWFTDAYGYQMSLPMEPYTWDFLTNGTGYMKTNDGQPKWYDEEFNLYDENPNPENKTTEERKQDSLEEELRANSEAQAYLMENRGASMGGHKIGDKTMYQLMSETGNDDEGYLQLDANGNAKTDENGNDLYYSPSDLEAMSDIELVDLALRDPELRQYMVDTYGEGWNDTAALNSQWLNADIGDMDTKRQIANDLFFGENIDPVLKAQLQQRIYNANSDIADMVDENNVPSDKALDAILEAYGFNNPIDMAQWAMDSEYQAANPLTYDLQAALFGSDIYGNTNGYNGAMDAVGLDANDVALWALLGNMDNRGGLMFTDLMNNHLNESTLGALTDLLGYAGYGDEIKKGTFEKTDDKGKKRLADREGVFDYSDWEDPNRNWSMAALRGAIDDANQSPEELMRLLGVGIDPTTGNAVLGDAADRIFSEALANGKRYGARSRADRTQEKPEE